MSVNADPRIRIAEKLKKGASTIEHWLTLYQKHVMRKKLQPIFTEGQRVYVKIRDTTYTGVVIENRKTIYTHGENGFLEVFCKWDNPEPHWRDGIFSFNQIHLSAVKP